VRAELDQQGPAAVLISRSGLDLSRFGLRYSHAGLALADGAGSAWAVRQLYYACDEARPRLFDQGLAGFVAGTSDPERGFVSLLLLPPPAAAMLAHTALDRPRALRLLADRYSANAHAWSLRYQNCNQWLIELLAASEGTLADGPDLRARAQDWLREAGYQPAAVDAGSHLLMFAAGFVPWLRLDDRPEDQRYSLTFQLTLPRSLEAFVRQRWPEARRIALCHAGDRVLVRRGWAPLPRTAAPAPATRCGHCERRHRQTVRVAPLARHRAAQRTSGRRGLARRRPARRAGGPGWCLADAGQRGGPVRQRADRPPRRGG
jgi:hypothetical protein